MRILVTAANGKTGRHVISALRRRSESVTIRAFARGPVAMADDATEIVQGTWTIRLRGRAPWRASMP